MFLHRKCFRTTNVFSSTELLTRAFSSLNLIGVTDMNARTIQMVMAAFLIFISGLRAQIPDSIFATPKVSTSTVSYDADDPAIWIHPDKPELSLIIGTDKGTYPNGGIFTWNLDGTQQQRINISHPCNVDVRYGMMLSGSSVDIAAVTMRDHREIRIFKIDPVTRTLSDITSPDSILTFRAPFGIALYKRPSDGAMFVFLSSKAVESKAKIWQFRLDDDGTGRVKRTLVRIFGDNTDVVDGMIADDEVGYLYVAEEAVGIHKYYADPEKGNDRLALFATDDGIVGHRHGLALYKCNNGTGYLLATNPGTESIKIYRREGDNGDPHHHNLVTTLKNTLSRKGFGVDATSVATTADFPHGFLVWHNEKSRNFQLYAWEDVAQGYLTVCSNVAIPASVEPGAMDTSFRIELMQNFPNPFNPETEISFQMPRSELVRLTVYDLNGREIKLLHYGNIEPGFHVIHWNGKDSEGKVVPSGTYLYTLQTDRFYHSKKMTLLR